MTNVHKLKGVTVYDNQKDIASGFSSQKTQPIQINWSALGEVSIEEAEHFSKELVKAIKLAKRLLK